RISAFSASVTAPVIKAANRNAVTNVVDETSSTMNEPAAAIASFVAIAAPAATDAAIKVLKSGASLRTSPNDIFSRRPIANTTIARSSVWTDTNAVIAPSRPEVLIPMYSAPARTGIIANESFRRKYFSESNERRIDVGTKIYNIMFSRLIAKIGAADTYVLVKSVAMNSYRTTN